MGRINETGKVEIGQAWKDFWRGSLDFRGNSTRAGFWWGILLSRLTSIAAFAVVRLLMVLFLALFSENKFFFYFCIGMCIAVFVLVLVLAVAEIALLTRRLRDTGLKNIIVNTLVIGYILSFFGLFFAPLVMMIACILVLTAAFIILCCIPTGSFSKKQKNIQNSEK